MGSASFNNLFRSFTRARVELIVPTARNAKYLQHCYGQWHLQQGNTSWERPLILTWGDWCRRKWESLSLCHKSHVRLLNNSQQQRIWQKIIEQSDARKYCLYTLSTSRVALRAYQLAKQYHLPSPKAAVVAQDPMTVSQGGRQQSIDTHAFAQWLHTYQQYLQENQWIDSDSLPEVILPLLQQDKPSLHNIIVYGFQHLTPQQKTFFATLKGCGVGVEMMAVCTRNESVSVREYLSVREEIRAAAQWAKEILQIQPQAHIGIVSLQLQPKRAFIARELERILNPQALLSFTPDSKCIYTIAPGILLGNYALIHTAVCILRLAVGQRLTIEELAAIFLSPWVGGAQAEQGYRALAHARLHEVCPYGASLDILIKKIRKISSSGSAIVPQQLVEQLRKLRSAAKKASTTQSPAEWAETFATWLQCLGWHGEQPLDSQQYQLLQAWLELLEDFASLQICLPLLDGQQAFMEFNRLLENRSFQAETKETPLQVSGMEGVAAMQFDYLWLLEMHDQLWPSSVHPSPFLPLSAQIAAGIPQASVQEQQRQDKIMTDALITSAGSVVFSYAVQEEDRSLRRSPLLPADNKDNIAVHSTGDSELSLVEDYRHQVWHSTYWQKFTESAVPLCDTGDQMRDYDGGSGLLKDQAACPFRAFAQHRLRARALHKSSRLLEGQERGQVLHNSMEVIWQQYQSLEALQQAFATKSHAEITSWLKTIIRDNIHAHESIDFPGWSKRFVQLEIERIYGYIDEWLQIERQRSPFVVKEREQQYTVNFHGLSFKFRPDRVDQLADGSLVIIDYKTGKSTSSKHWFGERPEEPQLPLYALIFADMKKQKIAAIAFAIIHAGQVAFDFAGEEKTLPGKAALQNKKTASWTQVLQEWQDNLHLLIEEYQNGNAVVSPLRGEETCRYCDLPVLCRIHEQRQYISQEESDDPD